MRRTYTLCLLTLFSCTLITACGGDDTSSNNNSATATQTPQPQTPDKADPTAEIFSIAFLSASDPTLDTIIDVSGTVSLPTTIPAVGSFQLKAFENAETTLDSTTNLLNKSYTITGAGQNIQLSQKYYFTAEGKLIAYQIENSELLIIDSPQKIPTTAEDGDSGPYLEYTAITGEKTSITWDFSKVSDTTGTLALTGNVVNSKGVSVQSFTESYNFTKDGVIESYTYSAETSLDGTPVTIKLQ